MKANLTARFIESAKPPKSGRLEIHDTILTGLCFRVTAKGSKSFSVVYRHNGRFRRFTIGAYPAFSLAAARDEARLALQAIEKGEDPAAEKRSAKSAPPPRTFGEVVERFMTAYSDAQRRGWEVRQIIERELLPVWENRPAASIAPEDVIEAVDKVRRRGAMRAANRLLSIVKIWGKWAASPNRRLIPANPAADVEPEGRTVSRDRTLTDGEIESVWRACDEIGYPFGPLVKLLIVLGQRRGETSRMKWSDLDLDAAVWEIPREETKSDRAHRVPLPALALEILNALPRRGELVFTTTGGPVQGFNRAKRRLDKASGVTGWRMHDLRRTAASGLASLSVPPHVLSKILNHATGGGSAVTAIYNRFGYDGEKAAALESWSRKLRGIVSGAAAGNVVAING